MLEYRHMSLIKPGTMLICVVGRGCRDITDGKVYQSVHGAEDGIFTSRPFVTVVADDYEHHLYHLSRFELASDRWAFIRPYLDEINQAGIPYISRSHNTLYRLCSQYGKEAVHSALDDYFRTFRSGFGDPNNKHWKRP